MEITTLSRIKKKAGSFFENQYLQSATVLEVREWEPATLTEIDLHLPGIDMSNWTEVPYLKVKVAEFTYRDYTPSGWDAETSTCTLYVDTAHEGAGSKWARSLKKGDTVNYIKTIRSTDHGPAGTPAVIAMGDESSIGHLLALQQLVLPVTRFSGAILMSEEGNRRLFSEYFRSPIQAIKGNDVYGHHTLIQWVIDRKFALDNTEFYIAGNYTMVAQLRKLLILQGYSNNQIKVQGFWK